MRTIKKNNTNIKLVSLIIIFLVGFLSLFILNHTFTKLVNKLDTETKNLEYKSNIGEFIAYDILKIRSLFNELSTTTSSKRSRDLLVAKIDTTINSIEKSLDILENGGIFKREITLNKVGHRDTTKTIKYTIAKKENFSLKVINIKPKLKHIVNMTKELEVLLKSRELYRKAKDTDGYSSTSKKLQRYYQTIPPFFNKLSENIRRLLYDGEADLKILHAQIMQDKNYYQRIKIYLILFIVLVVIIFGYIIVKNVNKDSETLYNLNVDLNDHLQRHETQEKYIRAILDNQANITIVSNGKKMLNGNKKLLEFFSDYKDFDHFVKENDCICEFFETNVPSKEYIVNKNYGELSWANYILENPDKNLKIIMKQKSIKHHFTIFVTKTILNHTTNESVFIISLNDITNEINSQIKLKTLNDNLEFIVQNKTKELQELNENLEQKVIIESTKAREKDKQLMQQARFAALGEMIGNIAHQWRQPLSAITTTASGMRLQLQLGLTTNDEVDESYSKIMHYVEFLTQTIEDFRGFFKEDKETVDFNIIKTLEKALFITSSVYKDHDIKIIKDYKNDEMISHAMPSELAQVFLNILNNAKDATISNNIEAKFVHITCIKENNNNVVYIQDNAKGIPKNIIEKVFDPYFTTKHQSQGTGIGLYMSKDIVENNMNGEITVKNITTILDNKHFNGACFKITIPQIPIS